MLATALSAGMTVHDLAELDLAYSPPYSSANDPVNLAAFIAENHISGFSPLVTAAQLRAALASDPPPVVLDVRTAKEWHASHLVGARHVPVDALRAQIESLPRDRPLYVHCRVGFRGHLALRILREHGFEDVHNVTGGFVSMALDGGLTMEGA